MDESVKVNNEKKLVDALFSEKNNIEVEGDFARKVIKIRMSGPAAFGLAIIALDAYIASQTAEILSGGTASAVAIPAMIGSGGAVTVAFGFATASAIKMVTYGKGVKVLKLLKEYDVKRISNKKIILIKK